MTAYFNNFKNMFNSKKNIIFFILLLLLLQLMFIHAYLPVKAWFSNDAIYTDDFSFHYGHTIEKITYLKKFGNMWGYNPFNRAGTIANANTTIDINGCALFSFLLFFLPVEISFKLYFILGILIVPILCYKAARNFGFSEAESLLSSLLGTLLMHVSVIVNFIYWGTISFIFSSYIAVLIISYFYSFCLKGKLKDLAYSTLLSIVVLWIHAFSLLILFVPLLICYIISFRRIKWLHHLSIVISLLTIIAANIPWAFPFVKFLDNMVKDYNAMFHTTDTPLEPLKTYLFRKHLFNSYMNMVFHKEEWVDIILLLSAIMGIYIWNKNRERLKTALFLISCTSLFIFSYYG